MQNVCKCDTRGERRKGWRKVKIDRNETFSSGSPGTRGTFVYYVILALRMANVGEWSDVGLKLRKDPGKMVFVWCLKRVRRPPTRRIESEPQKFRFSSTEYRLLFRNIFLSSCHAAQQHRYVSLHIFMYPARIPFAFGPLIIVCKCRITRISRCIKYNKNYF